MTLVESSHHILWKQQGPPSWWITSIANFTLSKNNSIILTWIPSHIGIQGNERADRAVYTRISNTKIPYTNLKPLINKFILKKWQKSWNDQTQNKLHHIQDTIGEWPAGYRRNRKEVIISRLRIGHTHITHSHLLKWEDSPVCSIYKVLLPVKHILINCDRFRQIRPKHYQTNNLKNLFKNSKPEEILSFLKEINLFIKI